jgi:DNA invertase Pin-like site-specific DNA recombinase
MRRNHQNKIVCKAEPFDENKCKQPKSLRVAACARVSTDSNDKENSLKIQKKHFATTIRANPNWEYVGLYADEGTRRTSTRNRKEFNRMLEECKKGKIDLIVVKDVSRFARNVVDCLNTAELLLNLDPPVGIFFEDDNLNTLDTSGKIALEMFVMLEEREKELKRKQAEWRNSTRTQT